MASRRRERKAFGSVGSTWPSEAPAPAPRRDPVEEAGDESFPASDPPAWTLGVATAARGSAEEAAAALEAPPPVLHEVEIGAVGEIPEGEVRGVEIEGREISVCRRNGEVFALSGACSYHPIPLRGAKLEGEVLTCQWYGAQFDVRTGESVFLRSVGPLTTYSAEVRGGRVFVRVPAKATPPSSRWVGAER